MAELTGYTNESDQLQGIVVVQIRWFFCMLTYPSSIYGLIIVRVGPFFSKNCPVRCERNSEKSRRLFAYLATQRLSNPIPDRMSRSEHSALDALKVFRPVRLCSLFGGNSFSQWPLIHNPSYLVSRFTAHPLPVCCASIMGVLLHSPCGIL